jgi:oligopeptide transport system ATP-binding protein
MIKKEVLLSINELQVAFGNKTNRNIAVKDASFDIYKGETFGLVGESGSGKTTIGRTIVRINPAYSGSITFEGKPIMGDMSKADLKQLRKDIQMIYQDPASSLNERANIDYIISEGLRAFKLYKNKDYKSEQLNLWKQAKIVYAERIAAYNKKMSEINANTQLNAKAKEEMVKEQQVVKATIESEYKASKTQYHKYLKKWYLPNQWEEERKKLVYEVLESVGLLPEHLLRYPHEFSGGQRQRIGIARSIVMRPKLIVADEPISALDVSIRAQVLNLLKKFQKDYDLTYLFIAHDLSVVRFVADRIAVISNGTIVELANTETLFSHPLHPYTKSLLSAIPQPDPTLEKNKKTLQYIQKTYTEDNRPLFYEVEEGHYVYGSLEEIDHYKLSLSKMVKDGR